MPAEDRSGGAARSGSALQPPLADVLGLPRRLSRIEAGQPQALAAALRAEEEHGADAHIIGITGAPGVGKSTVIGRMIAALRDRGLRVAVLAVDPSSARSGGALLGDRVRLLRSHGDPEVFVRSMASRGRLGGLSGAAPAAVAALAGAGFEVVLVETVGVGQSEMDVARLADTTVVVLAPGMGDQVQALKAGLLEEADVLAVNKADRPGAGQTVAQLNAVLDAGDALAEVEWRPPVLRTSAITGAGVEQLLDAVQRHRESPGHQRERPRLRAERVRWALRDTALQQVLRACEPHGAAEAVLAAGAAQVARGTTTLEQAARELLRAVAS